MAPLVKLLALATLAAHAAWAHQKCYDLTNAGKFKKIRPNRNASPQEFGQHPDHPEVNPASGSEASGPTTPIQICTDDQCQNCVAAPDVPEETLLWPSCSVHNVTDVLENNSGAQQAFFKIPEPEPGCMVLIRRPVPGVSVQNCGMVTAVYSKATCAAQPRAGNKFMVQKCCGDACFDSRPQARKRSADDAPPGDVPEEAPEAEPETEETLERRGKKKKPRSYVHCGAKKDCWKNTQCPAGDPARPVRGPQADPHSPHVRRAATEMEWRFEEQNNFGAKYGLGIDLGDLGLSSTSDARDRALEKPEQRRRQRLWEFCMKDKASWLIYGRYTKPADTTQVVQPWTKGGPNGHAAAVQSKRETAWSTSLSLGRDSLPFVRDVFEAVMYHKSIPCAVRDEKKETFEVPANRAGYLGFTPILDCVTATHVCMNWMGDPQIHEFCIPRLNKNEAEGIVSFIESN